MDTLTILPTFLNKNETCNRCLYLGTEAVSNSHIEQYGTPNGLLKWLGSSHMTTSF
jgi:hypothetical protein